MGSKRSAPAIACARRRSGRRVSTVRARPRNAAFAERFRAQRRRGFADRDRRASCAGVPDRARRGAAAAGPHRRDRGRRDRAGRRRRLLDRPEPTWPVDHPDRRRRGRLRGLSRRTVRPEKPILRLSADQLHPLRAALYDHPRSAIRPRPNFDGGVCDVRGLRSRLRRPGEPPLSRRADRVSALRAKAYEAAGPGRRRIGGWRDRGAEGDWRLPASVRCA